MSATSSLTVWKSRLRIPEMILRSVSKVKAPRGLRDEHGVDYHTVRGLNCECLLCDGLCKWHTDPYHDQFVLLWVLRNDWGSSLQTWNQPLIAQPVGTMMILNDWKKHRLWHRLGLQLPPHPYVVACIGTDDCPSKKKCELLFASQLAKNSQLA